MRSGTTWSQQAYLTASNRGVGDHFGAELAASEDTLVVGVDEEDSDGTGVNGQQGNDASPQSGAAYVFARSGTVWSQQAYLKASNAAAGDSFGTSVSASGTTLVIGATSEDSAATGVNGDQLSNGAPGSGAAYVFVRNGVNWSQQAYLKPSNTALLGIFGKSAAVSKDTAVIGSYGVGTAGGNPGIGAAYVFVRSGTTWTQQAYLQASNAAVNDQFGWDVAASGEAVVVGAHMEDSAAAGVDGDQADNSFDEAGAAYVFVRAGTTWSQRAYLKASYPGDGDHFGRVVALSDGSVVIGASFEDSNSQGVNGAQSNDNATDSGAAYVFDLKLASLELASGASGALNSQTFDGTRGVDATVLATQNLNVTSITLSGLVPGVLSTAHVSARIYSSSGSLIAASDAIDVEEAGDVTLPLTAILKPGLSYRIAFRVDSTGFFNATASLFDPAPAGAAGFPYNELDGLLRINSGHTHPADAYPVTASPYVPQITVNATLGDQHWSAVGSGLVGAFGLPTLTGSGQLLGGSTNKLELLSAKPSATAALFFGTSQVNVPFKGGVLVPSPMLTTVLTTSPSGSVTLPFVLPAGLPAAFPLYSQFWIQDALTVAGFSATKGLKGLTP